MANFAGQLQSRSPYGERGLKYFVASRYGFSLVSLSLRRAWIEIFSRASSRAETCRSPYGERGLKSRSIEIFSQKVCRSPYGERGLKLGVTVYAVVFGVSLFLRRAWIEMSLGSSYLTASLCRSPYGECGLK